MAILNAEIDNLKKLLSEKKLILENEKNNLETAKNDYKELSLMIF
jgi:hypothetical protein